MWISNARPLLRCGISRAGVAHMVSVFGLFAVVMCFCGVGVTRLSYMLQLRM